jgi:hypothetical protein
VIFRGRAFACLFGAESFPDRSLAHRSRRFMPSIKPAHQTTGSRRSLTTQREGRLPLKGMRAVFAIHLEATMLGQLYSLPVEAGAQVHSVDLRIQPDGKQPALFTDPAAVPRERHEATLDFLFNDNLSPEWSEQDIVYLHWRLLLELRDLVDPQTPLETKLDTLRWVFTDPAKDSKPFSFVSCLRVVGCSPLSPTAYFGALDADDIRAWIRGHVKEWLHTTLARYPSWARDALLDHPEWVASRLEKNPQWLNEQVKQHESGDLFI